MEENAIRFYVIGDMLGKYTSRTDKESVTRNSELVWAGLPKASNNWTECYTVIFTVSFPDCFTKSFTSNQSKTGQKPIWPKVPAGQLKVSRGTTWK